MEILKQIQADAYIKLCNKDIKEKTKNPQNIVNIIQKFIDKFKQRKISRAKYAKMFIQVQTTIYLVFIQLNLFKFILFIFFKSQHNFLRFLYLS